MPTASTWSGLTAALAGYHQLADLQGIPVVRPKVIETTALGAAYLAGLSCGVYGVLTELSAQWQAERVFHPTLPRERAAELMQHWEHAVAQATL